MSTFLNQYYKAKTTIFNIIHNLLRYTEISQTSHIMLVVVEHAQLLYFVFYTKEKTFWTQTWLRNFTVITKYTNLDFLLNSMNWNSRVVLLYGNIIFQIFIILLLFIKSDVNENNKSSIKNGFGIFNTIYKMFCITMPTIFYLYPIPNFQINLSVVLCNINSIYTSEENECWKGNFSIHMTFAIISICLSSIQFIILSIFYIETNPFVKNYFAGQRRNRIFDKFIMKLYPPLIYSMLGYDYRYCCLIGLFILKGFQEYNELVVRSFYDSSVNKIHNYCSGIQSFALIFSSLTYILESENHNQDNIGVFFFIGTICYIHFKKFLSEKQIDLLLQRDAATITDPQEVLVYYLCIQDVINQPNDLKNYRQKLKIIISHRRFCKKDSKFLIKF